MVRTRCRLEREPLGALRKGPFMLDEAADTLTHRLMRLVEQLLVGKSSKLPICAQDSLTDVGLSSIDMVNLMLAVEAEFDIMIPPADITPQNFRSVASIEAMIARLARSASV
jgi:acyl carrier protein